MQSRGRNYQNLDGLAGTVAWYWWLLAFASWMFILGGFLMLPAAFEKVQNPSILRVSQAAVGIFAAALLAAGFSFTVLLCFAIQSAQFRINYICIPALISSGLGLLTVLYDFLLFTRYTFNIPAVLTTVAAAVATIIYAILLMWSQRNIRVAMKKDQPDVPLNMRAQDLTHQHLDSTATLWQGQAYYDNYNKNMFPSANGTNQPPLTGYGYDPYEITEEEMQRQQMLMLLLQKDKPSTPDPAQSTFRIDWQGRDEDDVSPLNGHYAPQPVPSAQTAYQKPSPGFARQLTNAVRPWDGVWRTPARVDHSMWARPASRELREARRLEIEQGRR